MRNALFLLLMAISIILSGAYFSLSTYSDQVYADSTTLGLVDTNSPGTGSQSIPSIPPALHVSPTQILQGDPAMITLSGTSELPIKGVVTSASGATASSASATATSKITTLPLYFFLYQNHPTALYGSDLDQKTGTTTVIVTLKNGSQLSTSFVILPRTQPQEYLPVPAQLGGNSTVNQGLVVSTLEKENTELAAVHSRTDKALWNGSIPFVLPVASPAVITDPYGYDRESGAATIAHKGVDFRAPPGTPVYAIARGVVRIAKTFSVYGNAVIVDHGFNLLSMYMHLSKIDVIPGQLVQKGQLVGLSGETGYAEGPHLHLTVRINNISVDPIAFFALFKVTVK
jgi:hypothetical protein